MSVAIMNDVEKAQAEDFKIAKERLSEIEKTGVIPHGAIIASNPEIIVILEGDQFCMYAWSNDGSSKTLTKKLPAVDNETYAACVDQYKATLKRGIVR